MKQLFDEVSANCSKLVTRKYSTSFSLGIRFLHHSQHEPIYAIYGFVRFADEIVDSFHGFNKRELMKKFREDTVEAILERISLNPILNSFQKAVHEYGIEWNLIDTFLKSMEMDLERTEHDLASYETYILGSAEVVGLMCLKVFVKGNEEEYLRLKPYAMSLGAAFQKVNFLRDAQADLELLGRTYFPGVNIGSMSEDDKRKIEEEIEKDFDHALIGIRSLGPHSRSGVYLAYYYYKALFHKIKSLPSHRILKERIRIPNVQKFGLMFQCAVRNQLNLL